MGFGKIFKKVFKAATKPLKAAAAGIAGVAGIDKAQPVAAVPDQAIVPAAAAVEAPPKDTANTGDESQTEAGKKKTARSGKKSLSVSRSTGNGVNI